MYFLGRRRAEVDDEQTGDEKGVLTRVARHIKELQFDYYDNEQWLGREWRLEKPPQMVKVSMVLVDPAGEKPELPLSQVIALEPLPLTDGLEEGLEEDETEETKGYWSRSGRK